MNLKDEIGERATVVNEELKEILAFKGLKIYDAMRYLILAGGKRLRPVIAMLSCESVGGKKENAIPFAVALELVHNFTLLHDDIMDRDGFRRGMKTTHVVFGEPRTIIAGDALFALAYEEILKLKIKPEKLKILLKDFSVMVREIAEGQDMDIDFEKRTDVSEEEYLEMVGKKTARIIKTAAMGGAIIGNGSTEQVEKLAEYGRLVGIGFQIWDDVLGLVGDPKRTGKPVGNDIRRGKKTLIVVHGLSHADEEDRKTLLNIVGKDDVSDEEVENAVEIVGKTNSIDYAKNMALGLVEKAKENLNVLPGSDSRQVLSMIAEYCVGRDK
ncbi:MAG: polyprenyl synthetase family protein [Thermoplasmatales archaeon]|nr:polyprenyl synthetase family protein [Thermoplasmatales archaeon]